MLEQRSYYGLVRKDFCSTLHRKTIGKLFGLLEALLSSEPEKLATSKRLAGVMLSELVDKYGKEFDRAVKRLYRNHDNFASEK